MKKEDKAYAMNDHAAKGQPAFPILFFDGDCALCNASVRFILRHERAPVLRFAALQSAIAQERLKGKDLPDSLVLLQGENMLVKTDAALYISTMLKGWPSGFRYLRFVPRPVRDLLYDLIARIRKPFFGKSLHCALTLDVDQTRFLDL